MKICPKDEMVNAAGTRLDPSPWIELSQDRINTFADWTEDHQFIHIDEKKAAQTPFGGTIAHGFLTLSMLFKLAENCMIIPENLAMGMNYGFDKVRFLVKMGVSVEIEGEETPALVAEWLNLFVAA